MAQHFQKYQKEQQDQGYTDECIFKGYDSQNLFLPTFSSYSNPQAQQQLHNSNKQYFPQSLWYASEYKSQPIRRTDTNENANRSYSSLEWSFIAGNNSRSTIESTSKSKSHDRNREMTSTNNGYHHHQSRSSNLLNAAGWAQRSQKRSKGSIISMISSAISSNPMNSQQQQHFVIKSNNNNHSVLQELTIQKKKQTQRKEESALLATSTRNNNKTSSFYEQFLSKQKQQQKEQELKVVQIGGEDNQNSGKENIQQLRICGIKKNNNTFADKQTSHQHSASYAQYLTNLVAGNASQRNSFLTFGNDLKDKGYDRLDKGDKLANESLERGDEGREILNTVSCWSSNRNNNSNDGMRAIQTEGKEYLKNRSGQSYIQSLNKENQCRVATLGAQGSQHKKKLQQQLTSKVNGSANMNRSQKSIEILLRIPQSSNSNRNNYFPFEKTFAMDYSGKKLNHPKSHAEENQSSCCSSHCRNRSYLKIPSNQTNRDEINGYQVDQESQNQQCKCFLNTSCVNTPVTFSHSNNNSNSFSYAIKSSNNKGNDSKANDFTPTSDQVNLHNKSLITRVITQPPVGDTQIIRKSPRTIAIGQINLNLKANELAEFQTWNRTRLENQCKQSEKAQEQSQQCKYLLWPQQQEEQQYSWQQFTQCQEKPQYLSYQRQENEDIITPQQSHQQQHQQQPWIEQPNKQFHGSYSRGYLSSPNSSSNLSNSIKNSSGNNTRPSNGNNQNQGLEPLRVKINNTITTINNSQSLQQFKKMNGYTKNENYQRKPINSVFEIYSMHAKTEPDYSAGASTTAATTPLERSSNTKCFNQNYVISLLKDSNKPIQMPQTMKNNKNNNDSQLKQYEQEQQFAQIISSKNTDTISNKQSEPATFSSLLSQPKYAKLTQLKQQITSDARVQQQFEVSKVEQLQTHRSSSASSIFLLNQGNQQKEEGEQMEEVVVHDPPIEFSFNFQETTTNTNTDTNTNTHAHCDISTNNSGSRTQSQSSILPNSGLSFAEVLLAERAQKQLRQAQEQQCKDTMIKLLNEFDTEEKQQQQIQSGAITTQSYLQNCQSNELIEFLLQREKQQYLTIHKQSKIQEFQTHIESQVEHNSNRFATGERKYIISSVLRVQILSQLIARSAELSFQRETFHRAVIIFDAYVEEKCQQTWIHAIHQKKEGQQNIQELIQMMKRVEEEFSLIATACLYITAKHEEEFPPCLNEMIKISAAHISAEEQQKVKAIQSVELSILKHLGWQLELISPCTWLNLMMVEWDRIQEKLDSEESKQKLQISCRQRILVFRQDKDLLSYELFKECFMLLDCLVLAKNGFPEEEESDNNNNKNKNYDDQSSRSRLTAATALCLVITGKLNDMICNSIDKINQDQQQYIRHLSELLTFFQVPQQLVTQNCKLYRALHNKIIIQQQSQISSSSCSSSQPSKHAKQTTRKYRYASGMHQLIEEAYQQDQGNKGESLEIRGIEQYFSLRSQKSQHCLHEFYLGD